MPCGKTSLRRENQVDQAAVLSKISFYSSSYLTRAKKSADSSEHRELSALIFDLCCTVS
jgi:hypothetical protein